MFFIILLKKNQEISIFGFFIIIEIKDEVGKIR